MNVQANAQDDKEQVPVAAEQAEARFVDTGHASARTGADDVVERLQALARAIEDNSDPLYASDAQTDERVPMPGCSHDDSGAPESWFIVRRIDAVEAKKFGAIQQRASMYMKLKDQHNEDVERRIEASPADDEAFLYLLSVGIQQWHLVDGKGSQHAGKWQPNRSIQSSQACNDFRKLTPRVGTWLFLFLQHANGLTDEQEADRGNE